MAYNNRFTERAQKALQLASEAAASMGHSYIGSEHILLGLVREGGGVAAKALVSSGITDEKVVGKIEELIGVDYTGTKTQGGEMTPRTKRIIELGWTEAQRMGQSYIATEHILMGILREGDSVAMRILGELGAEPQKLYDELARLFGSGGQQQKQGETNSGDSKAAATPTIDQFSRDLTQLAKNAKIDPVIGRAKEIDRVVQILSRRTKNNPCLIGEPGVGKTAIAEGKNPEQPGGAPL